MKTGLAAWPEAEMKCKRRRQEIGKVHIRISAENNPDFEGLWQHGWGSSFY